MGLTLFKLFIVGIILILTIRWSVKRRRRLHQNSTASREIVSGEPICPCCSNRLEENVRSCEICGTVFKTKIIPASPYVQETQFVWENGFPEARETIVIDKDCSYEYKPAGSSTDSYFETDFDSILKVDHLSRPMFEEIFSTLDLNIKVSPIAFIKLFLRYSGGMSLEERLRYIIPKIPKEVRNFEELRVAVRSFFKTYDAYEIDRFHGGGWLLPYDYPVDVEPPVYPLELQDYTPSIRYDYWYERQVVNRVCAHEVDSQKLCCFNIVLSEKESVTLSQMLHFWASLRNINEPVVFEIIGVNGKIVFQFLCHESDKSFIARQLSTALPNSMINQGGNDHDYLGECIKSEESYGGHFGLSHHYSYALETFTSFDKTDPLNPIMLPISEVADGQGGVIQAIVCPGKRGWDEHLKKIDDVPRPRKGDSRLLWTAFQRETGRDKLKSSLFAVCLRAACFGGDGKVFLNGVRKGFTPFIAQGGNSIDIEVSERPRTSDETVFGMSGSGRSFTQAFKRGEFELSQSEVQSILDRNTYRHGFILNNSELAGLLHFPSRSLQHPKLLRQEAGIAKAPQEMTAGKGLLIGVNEVHGEAQDVYVPEDFRFRHIYVVGKTGTGKTTLLLNMINSDIDSGKGLGLIDPHGDLVEKVLRLIPEERIGDVILFDPTDYEYPIGFNMFQVSDHIERRQMRSDIVVAIRRLFEGSSWGENIDHLFRTSVATLLADTSQVHTLLDIRKLISDDVFRSQVLRRLDDEYLKEFWTDDFPRFTQSTISAVKRRLASVLGEPEVRDILGQSETSFSFKDMMDTRKIFLANLSRGRLGEGISSLFGGLLVSKVQLTAMARASQPESERVPFYLYVDEFQNFVSESFEVILSEARKYKLCLTIAHQFTGQLPSRIYDAVFGNVGTLIVFEVGVDDAISLEKQLGDFSRDDIINLERFRTFTRVGKARDTFSMRTLPPPEAGADFGDRIRQSSREKYCGKRNPQPTEGKQREQRNGELKFFE